MKKFLTPIFSMLLACSIAEAQDYTNSFYDFVYSKPGEDVAGKQSPTDNYRKNGVKEVVTKNITGNKKDKRMFKGFFTPYGTWAGYQSYDKKGNLKNSSLYHYIDSVHYDKISVIHKKDTFQIQYQFDKNMNVVKISTLRNGKSWHGFTQSTYNDKNQLTAMDGFSKNKKQYRYEYDYFDNGSRKETRYYNGKGKLKQVWNYTCTQAGDLQKKVVQTSYCKKRDYQADGSYYETFEGSDSKGNTRRMVNKYSKDSLLIESKEFNRKGKEIYDRVSEYDNHRKEIKTTFYNKGKLSETCNYTYNEKGLTATLKETTAKGKEFNKEYNYTYY